MKVVTLKEFGTYEAGVELDLPDSTAEALIAHKVVKAVKSDKDKKEK